VICFNLKRITVLECPKGCKGRTALVAQSLKLATNFFAMVVVARGYSALALDALEEVLNAITAFVVATVEWALAALTRGRGDHNAAALLASYPRSPMT
jgi:hypothetical protein